MSKVVCIIQARMGSTRLPGKVMEDICGKPMLQHVIERCKRAHTVQEVVVATTNKHSDSPIHNLCDDINIECYVVGMSVSAEGDVLGRYYHTARCLAADVIVRVTGDCPLVDPSIIDECVRRHIAADGAYTRTPDGYPKGADVEVFGIGELGDANDIEAYTKCSIYGKHCREHVTPSMYDHLPRYDITQRLCVDYQEDLDVVREVFHAHGPANTFTLSEACVWLNANPMIAAINQGVAGDDVR